MEVNNRLAGFVLMIALFVLSSCNGGQSIDNREMETEKVGVEKEVFAEDGIVRLSKIEVYPECLDEYLKYAVEVGSISLQTEAGVLSMYALQDKDNPCKITILETYASARAYKSHIASSHFQKYKQGTLHMVKTLELCDQRPLNPRNKIENYIE